MAEKDSRWFSPSESSFMINYRVDDLDEVIPQLREAGVEILKDDRPRAASSPGSSIPTATGVGLSEPMLWDDKNKQP